MKLTLDQVILLLNILKIYIPTASAYIEEEELTELEELQDSLERHLTNGNDTN